MQKTVVIEPLQKRFEVSLNSANRKKRNRYYSNASPCCNVRLKQEKKCSACEKLVENGSVTHKIATIGKEEYLIEADELKQVKDQLEAMEEMRVHTFLKKRPKGAEDRFDSLYYAKPAKKQEAQYAELREILNGRTAIGNVVIRSNEYQALIEVGSDGILRFRTLVEEGQRYDFDAQAINSEIEGKQPSQEIIDLERQILDKNSTDTYDITEFRDTRSEYEEQVIEEYVLHGRAPDTTTKPKVQEQAEQSELERLKALAGK